jgi:hypothetical protein
LEGLTKLLVVEAEDKNVAVEKRKTTDPIFDRAKVFFLPVYIISHQILHLTD